MWQLSAGTTLETFVMSALNDPTLFRFWHVVDPRFDEPLNIKPKNFFLKSQKYEENDIGSLIHVYEHAELFPDFLHDLVCLFINQHKLLTEFRRAPDFRLACRFRCPLDRYCLENSSAPLGSSSYVLEMALKAGLVCSLI